MGKKTRWTRNGRSPPFDIILIHLEIEIAETLEVYYVLYYTYTRRRDRGVRMRRHRGAACTLQGVTGRGGYKGTEEFFLAFLKYIYIYIYVRNLVSAKGHLKTKNGE